MPVPSNGSAGTAMLISTLPFSITQDVADQPNTTELWYRYIGAATDRMVGMVPYADNAGSYLPKLFVYTGTAISLTPFKIFGSTQRAAQIPITEGTQYFFRVIQGGVASPLGESLTFRALRAPQQVAPSGSVLAAEENRVTRTPVLSTTADNTVQFFIDDIEFMISSIGTTLAAGNLIGDGDFNDADALTIYDKHLQRVARVIPSYSGTLQFITSDTETFYLVYRPGLGMDLVVRTLTATGQETAATWTLSSSSANIGSGTPDRDGAIFYYGLSAVQRYDLTNSGPLSDLAAAVATYNISSDMLVMADGSIVVCYRKPVGPDTFVRRYATDGTILNTYTFGTALLDHLALSYTEPETFWVWLHVTTATQATYRQILASDGSTVTEATFDMFTNGPSKVSYDPTYATADDVPLFGPAPSCTFFVLQTDVLPDILPQDLGDPADYPVRYLRRSPIISDQEARIFHDRAQFVFQAGIGTTSGQGADPQCLMRFSDDGGHTWSSEARRSIGEKGVYNARVTYFKLGQCRNRVYEVVVSDPAIPVVLIDLILDLTKGTN